MDSSVQNTIGVHHVMSCTCCRRECFTDVFRIFLHYHFTVLQIFSINSNEYCTCLQTLTKLTPQIETKSSRCGLYMWFWFRENADRIDKPDVAKGARSMVPNSMLLPCCSMLRKNMEIAWKRHGQAWNGGCVKKYFCVAYFEHGNVLALTWKNMVWRLRDFFPQNSDKFSMDQHGWAQYPISGLPNFQKCLTPQIPCWSMSLPCSYMLLHNNFISWPKNQKFQNRVKLDRIFKNNGRETESITQDG